MAEAGGQQPIRDEDCGYQARVSRHEPEVEQGVEGEDMEWRVLISTLQHSFVALLQQRGETVIVIITVQRMEDKVQVMDLN